MAADALLAGGGALAVYNEEANAALSAVLGPNWLRQGVVDMDGHPGATGFGGAGREREG